MTASIKQKKIIDEIVKITFLIITMICASIIVLIVFFILIKGMSPFIKTYKMGDSSYRVNVLRFVFGGTWYRYPNIYSVGFIIINTFFVVLLATLIAVPISVLTALFIVRIAPTKLGIALNYVIEMLASIPSVIYGIFGMGVITVFVKNIASIFGIQTAGGISTLATILVLAIMIIPTITMISVTSIKAVKKEQINGSLALGASVTQTNFKIVLRGAVSGIFSGIVLGVGRALGEATAISMVCGNSGSGPNFNLFGTTRTLTSTMLLGLKETSGLDYDIRFSVGIILILVIIGTNALLNLAKKRLIKC